MQQNPEADHYFSDGCMRCPLGGTIDCKVHTWQKELKLLRSLVLSCGLDEELKWGVPCYTYKGRNIAVVSALKESCTLSFFKGALLQDSHNLLQKPGENTQAARLFRFTGLADIIQHEAVIRSYIYEALEIEKAGLKVQIDGGAPEYPQELQNKLSTDAKLKEAFERLTAGRKRSYILHISSARQSKTRISRVEKCIPNIITGKGFNEK